MSRQPDILDEMTKQELVAWIRKNHFGRLPRRSGVLFLRWEILSAKLMADRDAETVRWQLEKPDFAERDKLAIKFNASKDNDERLRLIHEIEKYDQKFRDHIAINQAHDRRRERIDRLYEQIDIAQQEEERS